MRNLCISKCSYFILQHITWHSVAFATLWLEFKNAVAVDTRLALAFASIHEQ